MDARIMRRRRRLVGDAPAAVILTWDGVATDATPGFTVGLPSGALAGDVLRIEASTGALYLTYTLQVADISAGEVVGVASADPLSDGSYPDFRARLERGGLNGPWATVTNGPVVVATSTDWQLEDASGSWQLEDGSGNWILEAA